MKIELEQVSPHEIEKRSFEIITEELNGRTFPEDQELVVKRCIHTSADFDYADNLCFSEHAVAKGIEAIREGACIVTDTQMARSGINKKVLYVRRRCCGKSKRNRKHPRGSLHGKSGGAG